MRFAICCVCQRRWQSGKGRVVKIDLHLSWFGAPLPYETSVPLEKLPVVRLPSLQYFLVWTRSSTRAPLAARRESFCPLDKDLSWKSDFRELALPLIPSWRKARDLSDARCCHYLLRVFTCCFGDLVFAFALYCWRMAPSFATARIGA